MDIKFCKKCILPSTKPDLEFNDDGLCQGCVAYNNRSKIDWKSRENEFRIFLNKFRSKNNDYDCIIPVSGGKDSTYQVIKLLEYDMNPLCVTATTDKLTELGRQNIENSVNRNSKLLISVTNLRDRYEKDKTIRFKIFVENNDKELFFKKKPFVNPGIRLYNLHYGIKDFTSNKYVVNFDKTYNSTLVSVDSEGMYFDFDMTSLPPGRVYSLCFLVIENGEERVYEKIPAKFRVEV